MNNQKLQKELNELVSNIAKSIGQKSWVVRRLALVFLMLDDEEAKSSERVFTHLVKDTSADSFDLLFSKSLGVTVCESYRNVKFDIVTENDFIDMVELLKVI